MPKTIVITGANSGIGFATAEELAGQGHSLCLACRNQEKASRARDQLLEKHPQASISLFPLDLASFESIEACAQMLLEDHPVIDVLINNAGAVPLRQKKTQEGFEMQFGANYLGHYLLTQRLMPALTAAAKQTGDARIVHVSSVAHMRGRLKEKNFRGYRFYEPMTAYSASKLGNLMFSLALARRLPEGVISLAYHPGAVDSQIWRGLPKIIRAPLKLFLMGPKAAGEMGANLATNPDHRESNGRYFSVQWPRSISQDARDIQAQDWLYAISKELTGLEEVV